MRLLVIGGSDAGIAAGLRARELDPTVQVTIALADRYPNWSICGLPYWLGGDVADHHDLAHRSRADLEAAGLEILVDTIARRLDPAAKKVTATGPDGHERTLGYDRLVIATGAEPVRPPMQGLELDGVHLLHTMPDALAVDTTLARGGPGSAVIVGGGYIGLEMAEALVHRGLTVTLAEQLPTVLPTVDPTVGHHLAEELTRHGVRVHTDTTVTGITKTPAGLRVAGTPGLDEPAELVLVSLGVRPDATLTAEAGAALGIRGAIQVTRRLATNLPHVWAAGDCAETYHALLGRPAYLPLGTTAHKQGRIAGENALGGDKVFAGVVGTQVVKVFDLAVAKTGLRDSEAAEAGFEPRTVEVIAPDHKPYYPGASDLLVRLTGDRASGRLLGAQLLGHPATQTPKRIDTVAAMLHQAATVEQLVEADLSYTPPFGSPWDPLQQAAHAWTAEVGRRVRVRPGRRG